MVFDNKGNVFVALYSGGIWKYSENLSSKEELSESVQPISISLTQSKAVVFAGFSTNKVFRLHTGAILAGTPSKAQLGDHSVVLRATNDNGYTEQSFTVTVIDNIQPTISSLLPVDGAINVLLTPSMSITFDEGIILGTTGTLNLKSNGATVASFDLSVANDYNAFTQSADKKTLSFDIANQLPVNSVISAEISEGFVNDSSANVFTGLTAASGEWDFTTVNDVTTGMNDELVSHITVSPNPCTSSFRVNGLKEEVAHVVISNIAGQVVLGVNYKGGEELDVSRLSSGIYLVTVELKGGAKQSIRLVK